MRQTQNSWLKCPHELMEFTHVCVIVYVCAAAPYDDDDHHCYYYY